MKQHNVQKVLKLSVSVSDESSSDTDLGEEGLVLSFQQEIIDTVDLLKPFDATKKPRRKGKDKTSSNKQYGENVSKEGKSTLMDIKKD